MGDPRHSGGTSGGMRVWRFADCVFDESNWTLTVGGCRVAVESKPLEILRQLLTRPGQVVSKAELLDAIWPGIAVVEASLPTAVHKLRVALRDEGRTPPIIETVPRIGYRLAVPLEIDVTPVADATDATGSQTLAPKPRSRILMAIALVAIGLAALLAFTLDNSQRAGNDGTARPTIREVDTAIRTLDVERIDALIAAGWDANMAIDSSGNTALNRLMDMCEWDPAHDRRRILLMARTLVDGGTSLTRRNGFGDTPYSIAKAPRFCGADHPITVMLHRLCYNGLAAKTVGDRCLASYEMNRRTRKADSASQSPLQVAETFG